MHASKTTPAGRAARVLLLWVLLLGACDAGGSLEETEPPAGSSSTAGGEPATALTCAAGPVERRPLVLPDGRQAYVEPESLVRVGPDMVVVGSPTYTWDVGGGPVRLASSGVYVAAYLGAEPRLVPAPVDAPIGVVRAVALDERRWAALFTEALPAADGSPEPGSVVALHYAEFDGARWSPVESLPLPEEGRVVVESSSPLVRAYGGLVWAAVRNPEGEALVYERRNGTWTVETVVHRGVEAAGLAAGPSGLWLALSGLDEGLDEPRKSVRLFHRDGGAWRLVSRDGTAETYTEIHTPSVMALPAGVTVGWIEVEGAGVARARVGVGLDAPGRLLTVDTSAPVVRALRTADGSPAWVLWHMGLLPGTGELRLLHAVGDSVVIDRSVPYPYTGFFAATAAGPTEVVVTGPEFSADPTRPTVRSLTLRFDPSCR